jgi:hypothetical protein
VPAGLHDRFQILSFAAAFRHFPHHQLRQREDGRQRIVEIVRDAAG